MCTCFGSVDEVTRRASHLKKCGILLLLVISFVSIGIFSAGLIRVLPKPNNSITCKKYPNGIDQILYTDAILSKDFSETTHYDMNITNMIQIDNNTHKYVNGGQLEVPCFNSVSFLLLVVTTFNNTYMGRMDRISSGTSVSTDIILRDCADRPVYQMQFLANNSDAPYLSGFNVIQNKKIILRGTNINTTVGAYNFLIYNNTYSNISDSISQIELVTNIDDRIEWNITTHSNKNMDPFLLVGLINTITFRYIKNNPATSTCAVATMINMIIVFVFASCVLITICGCICRRIKSKNSSAYFEIVSSENNYQRIN